MPPIKIKKTTANKPAEAQAVASPTHPLHQHRPIIIMAVGFAVLLSLMFTSLASTRKHTAYIKNYVPETITIDTSNWLVYQDTATGLTFMYPADWTIKLMPFESDRAVILTSQKDNKHKISVYISPNNFLGFDGLPQTKVSMSGIPAIAVTDTLIGIHKNNAYFTFDAGLSAPSALLFRGLLKTIAFEK